MDASAPSDSLSESPATPSADPTEAVGADWTQVHSIGDGSTRMVAGEIVWGDAGFLVVARQWQTGHGGPSVAGYSMWQSSDGQSWTQLAFPAPAEGTYSFMTLTGATDGSYVFHASHTTEFGPPASLVSLRSTDGQTWEPLETGLPYHVDILDVAEGPSGYLLVASAGNATLWLSPDGLTWELVQEFQQPDAPEFSDGDGGPEGYVVVGRRSAPDGSYERITMASADGRTWIERDPPFRPRDRRFIWDMAVSNHGPDWLTTFGTPDGTTDVWKSADGLEWSEAGSVHVRNTSSITAGLVEEVGDQVILAPGATVTWEGTPGAFSSTDGTTWTPIHLGADAWVGDLAIGDGVVAMTGTIAAQGPGFTSTGVIWIRAAD